MKLRKAGPSDINACVDIELPGNDKYRRIIRDALKRQVDNKHYLFIVAETDKNVVGFITARREEWNNSFYIERLYVTENFRSRNYGSMLLKEVIGRARKVKSRIIFLDLAPCNRKAMRFYMRNGFQRAGRINEYHGNPKKPYAVILSYKL